MQSMALAAVASATKSFGHQSCHPLVETAVVVVVVPFFLLLSSHRSRSLSPVLSAVVLVVMDDRVGGYRISALIEGEDVVLPRKAKLAVYSSGFQSNANANASNTSALSTSSSTSSTTSNNPSLSSKDKSKKSKQVSALHNSTSWHRHQSRCIAQQAGPTRRRGGVLHLSQTVSRWRADGWVRPMR
jgi:hypothetical protein